MPVYASITFEEIVIVMIIFEFTLKPVLSLIIRYLSTLKIGLILPTKKSSGDEMFSNVSVLGNSFFDDHAVVIDIYISNW